jgi:hypothetical protein
MAVQRLTAAYRSRPRPSSTLSAKASTTCPYYLDGDRTRNGSVIPVVDMRSRRNAIAMATVQFSRIAGGVRPPCAASSPATCAWGRPACAGLSKLNSMPATGIAPQEGNAGPRLRGRPGSVDVLGPTVARDRPGWAFWLRRGARGRSLERR